MEKLDVVVAVAGALILVAATAGAVLTAKAPQEPTWVVSFAPHEHVAAEGAARLDATTASASRRIVFELAEPNATALRGRVVVTPEGVRPFAPGVSAVARLVAPDGTVHEARGAGTGGAELWFDVALAPAPQEQRVGAASAEEAIAAADATRGAGVGTWTLHVEASTGAPTPGVAVSWRFDAIGWTADAAPAPRG